MRQEIISNWHKTRQWLSDIPSPTIKASKNKLLEKYKPERGAEVVEILLNMEASSEAFDEECNYTDENIIKNLVEEFTITNETTNNNEFILPYRGVNKMEMTKPKVNLQYRPLMIFGKTEHLLTVNTSSPTTIFMALYEIAKSRSGTEPKVSKSHWWLKYKEF